MRMHLQKPRGSWLKAGRRRHASFQLIRGRQVDAGLLRCRPSADSSRPMTESLAQGKSGFRRRLDS
jgi:hypothetical protein